MKNLLLIFVFTFLLVNSKAQKNVNIKYNNAVLENPYVKITVISAGSTEDFFKMKFDISNKTKDFLLFRTTDLKIKANGEEYNFTAKDSKLAGKIDEFIIPPNGTKTKMCDIKGSTFGSKDIQLIFNCIYKISQEKAQEIDIKDFTLPALEETELYADNFQFTLKKLVKEKSETKVVFKAVYSGEKTGIIDFNKAKVLMPDGKEYICNPSEHSPIICTKGVVKTFVLDWTSIPAYAGNMEKATMIINWKGVVSETQSEMIKMDVMSLKGE